MTYQSFCAVSVIALLAAASSGAAHAAEVADTAAADQPASDIVIVGKSYGREVGKTVTPLKDVANTVTIIDREQIEAQNLFTLEDALTATNGVTVTGVGSEDPSFLSRGFVINNFLIDGTPTFAFAFPNAIPDLFFFDRMEVLRGPAGLFSGSGNPAGSINMVRKRPLDELKLRASIGYGSYDNKRAELDLNAPVANGVAVRVGAMVQDQDQFFDVAHRNRHAAFAVAKVALGERTTFTFGGNYDRFKPAIQSGLPGLIGGPDGSDGQLLDIPRSTYLGADWNRFRSETWSGFAELVHELTDRWTIRASGLYTDVDRIDVYSYIGNQPITPTNGVTNHIAYQGDNYFKSKSADLNLIGSFSAFGRDQTLILGADYQQSAYESYYTRLSNYDRIDVYNPVSPAEPPLSTRGPLPAYRNPATGALVTQVYGGTDTDVEQYGLYGQMRLSPLQDLTLVGGGRVTWWETDITTLLPARLPSTGYKITAKFTPYAALLWDVTDDLNLYGSYADSFTPQTSAIPRFDGGQIRPLVGEQYEVGSKLSLFNERLLLSAAVYQITQSNRLFTDPALPDVVFQLGKIRSRGIEAEAQGEILPGWRVNGGYTYTKLKTLNDTNPVVEGISFQPVIPKHMVKAFTNYQVQDGALQGASIGGGFTFFDKTFGGNAAVFNADGTLRTRSSIVRQGSYALLDLRGGYQLNERVSLSVNVNNVFDKKYFSRIATSGRGNFYGSPRTVFATLRVSYP